MVVVPPPSRHPELCGTFRVATLTGSHHWHFVGRQQGILDILQCVGQYMVLPPGQYMVLPPSQISEVTGLC